MTIMIYSTGQPMQTVTPPLTPGTTYVLGLSGPPWGTVTFHCEGGCEDCPQSLDFPEDSPQTEFICPNCPKIVANCPGHQERVLR